MHWAQTSAIKLDAVLSSYNKMAEFYPSVLEYQGSEYGKTFKTLVPVGLSIQNARTTYLALLSYNTTAYADGNLNYTTDAQIGLQRDGGHVSYNIGRYIAALTFAEMIIPESIRVEGYELPDIRKTESVGLLPKEYTIIAQKSVFAAVESWKNGSLAVTDIAGYKEDPTTTFVNKFDDILYLDCAADPTLIEEALLPIFEQELVSDMVIESIEVQYNREDDSYLARLKIRFGYTSREMEIPICILTGE
jgi:hypothetical protein